MTKNIRNKRLEAIRNQNYSDSQAMVKQGGLISLCCLFSYTQSFTESVDETLVCDHSNESYRAVLSCGTVYCAVQVVLTFK